MPRRSAISRLTGCRRRGLRSPVHAGSDPPVDPVQVNAGVRAPSHRALSSRACSRAANALARLPARRWMRAGGQACLRAVQIGATGGERGGRVIEQAPVVVDEPARGWPWRGRADRPRPPPVARGARRHRATGRSGRHRAAPRLRTSHCCRSAAASAALDATAPPRRGRLVMRTPTRRRRRSRFRRCHRIRARFTGGAFFSFGRIAVACKRSRHREVRKRGTEEPAVRALENGSRFAQRRDRPRRMAAERERDPTGEAPDGSRHFGALDHGCVVCGLGMLLRLDDLATQQECPRAREVEKQIDQGESRGPTRRRLRRPVAT